MPQDGIQRLCSQSPTAVSTQQLREVWGHAPPEKSLKVDAQKSLLKPFLDKNTLLRRILIIHIYTVRQQIADCVCKVLQPTIMEGFCGHALAANIFLLEDCFAGQILIPYTQPHGEGSTNIGDSTFQLIAVCVSQPDNSCWPAIGNTSHVWLCGTQQRKQLGQNPTSLTACHGHGPTPMCKITLQVYNCYPLYNRYEQHFYQPHSKALYIGAEREA